MIDRVLEHLEGVHRSRSGASWMARCPAHDDKRASLSVKERDDGAVLLFCHAGCDVATVVQSAGLVMADLFPASPATTNNAPRASIVATYDYRDSDGTVLSQTMRYEPKGFSQRRPDGCGGWVANLDGVKRVPYRLPELLAADRVRTVFLNEGEKDTDRLASLGLVATCNVGGAGKWNDDLSTYLRGRERVTVLADNDEAGRAGAQITAESVHRIAGVADIRIIDFPELPEHCDVSDWLDAGHSLGELQRRVKGTAVWKPEARGRAPAAHSNGVSSDSRIESFTLTHVGDLLAEPDEATDWLVDDLLPSGGLGFVGAKPKAGKSTLVRNLTLAVAQGTEFLGRSCVQGTVIYLALEEKRAEVRRHFRQLGACPNDPIFVHIAKAPRDALPALLELIREHQPKLVTIDPLLRFTRVRDEKAYAELSNALEGVMAAARESNCCIVATHHSPKAQGTETIDALLGSTALSGAPDTVLVLRRREQERTVESVQRYGTDMERQLLQLDKATGRVSLGTTVAAAQSAATQHRIRELLSDGSEMTTDDLREAADTRKAAIVDALSALMQQGDVLRAGAGKKGDPYRHRLGSHIVFAVPDPTVGTAERNPDETPNPLPAKAEFRSRDGLPSVDSPSTAPAAEAVY